MFLIPIFLAIGSAIGSAASAVGGAVAGAASAIGAGAGAAASAVGGAATAAGSAVAGSSTLAGIGSAATLGGVSATTATGAVSSTAALIGAGVVAGGVSSATMGIVGGVSAYEQGKMTRNLYEFNSGIMKQNASIAQQNAAFEARRKRTEILRLAGSQEAAYGSSGLVMTGSALDVFSDTIAKGTMDELMIKYQGDIEASNYLNQANASAFQGGLALKAGKSAMVNKFVGAGSTLLGTAMLAAPLFIGSSGISNASSLVDGGALPSSTGLMIA